MNLDQLLDSWRNDPQRRRNISHWYTQEPVAAELAPIPGYLDPRLADALRAQGIEQLYSHQADAIESIVAGRHTVVVTPTASGKTLCYTLPVLDAILRDEGTRALYLFPTKALAQDQSAVLRRFTAAFGESGGRGESAAAGRGRSGSDEVLSIRHAALGAPDGETPAIKTHTYDGDTPANVRKLIRTAGHVVITNPDMLHSGILPHHTKWVRLFESLRFVVIDELHGYRGVFGSHVANVIRRLRRICRFYGSDPVFVCCSATIANPGELAARIIGEPAGLDGVSVIDRNGAPRGRKEFIFYNPPVVNAELGIRRSSILEATGLAAELIRNRVHTIVFARARTTAEILLTYLRDSLPNTLDRDTAIRGYRGGYLPNQRRQIEAGLRDGAIMGVVSTNALELGVDIGALDACVMTGYPGTVASTWQQAGRAGRRQGTAAAIMVGSSNPLDQFIMAHPDYFFGQPPEHGLINPDNLLILISHLKCAAFELPFDTNPKNEGRGEKGEGGDAPLFGTAEPATVLAALAMLEEDRVVQEVDGVWHWTDQAYPAEAISLRTAARDNVVIIDETDHARPRVIGEVDQFSAPMLVHTEAIYLHEGQQFHVDRYDPDEQKAYVHAVDVDYYTDADLAVRVQVLEQFSAEPVGSPRNHGEVLVGALPTKYKKIKLHTHENVGWGEIHLPEAQMHTGAYWLCLPHALTDRMQVAELQGALVGLANVLSTISPLFLMCDPRDIGVAAEVKSPFTNKATVTIYDKIPGGVGFSQKLHDTHETLLTAAHDLIDACGCVAGCPSCVGTPIEVGERGKRLTHGILKLLLGRRIPPATAATAAAIGRRA
jgi:DEAD/DEAH box helicase domain-containing protein